MAVNFSGSLSISGSISTTGTITMSGSIASASYAALATTASNANTSSYVVSSVTDTTQNTRLTTIEAVTGSYTTTSSFGSYTSSNDTTNTTQNARIAANEAKTGSYATTGSNYFIGTQVITGSVYISSNLIVQGSSSLQNITASAVSIGTNTVILNTDSPAVRFAGISVRDSGSNSAVTSSIWYDSLNNKWIYQNESGSSYSGGMFISGPRNTGSLGDEDGMTNGYITKGLGGDHIGPSIIFESGSNIGIGTATPLYKLDVSGAGRFVSENNTTALYINAGNNAFYQFKGNSTSGYTTTFNINDTGLYIGHDSLSRRLVLQTNSTDRLTISGTGEATFACSVTTQGELNVGFGILSADRMMQVSGTSFTSGTSQFAAVINPTFGNTITNLYGVYISLASGTSITNRYALFVDGAGAGTATNDYAIYSANASRSYFAGKIGIGVTSSNALLDISGGQYNTGLIVRSPSTNGAGIGILNSDTGGHSWYLISTATSNGGGAGNLGFYDDTAGNYHMYIKGSNGNVGIGTVCPDAKLTIGEDSSTTNVGYIRLRGHDIYEANIYKTSTYGLYIDVDSNAKPIRIDGSCLIAGIYGTVILGDTTPVPSTSYRLDVAGGYINIRPGYGLISRSSSTECWGLGDTDFNFMRAGCLGLGTFTSKHMMFATNNTVRQMIASSGEVCFASTVCAPLVTVNSAVRLYGNASGIGCAYIVTAAGADQQPAIILEKSGGYGQSEIRTYYNNVPDYGIAFKAGSITGLYLNSNGAISIPSPAAGVTPLNISQNQSCGGYITVNGDHRITYGTTTMFEYVGTVPAGGNSCVLVIPVRSQGNLHTRATYEIHGVSNEYNLNGVIRSFGGIIAIEYLNNINVIQGFNLYGTLCSVSSTANCIKLGFNTQYNSGASCGVTVRIKLLTTMAWDNYFNQMSMQ